MRKIIYCLLLLSVVSCKNKSGKTKAEKIDYLVQEAFEDKEFIGNILVSDQGEIIYQKSFGSAVKETCKIATPPGFLLPLCPSQLQPFLY